MKSILVKAFGFALVAVGLMSAPASAQVQIDINHPNREPIPPDGRHNSPNE